MRFHRQFRSFVRFSPRFPAHVASFLKSRCWRHGAGQPIHREGRRAISRASPLMSNVRIRQRQQRVGVTWCSRLAPASQVLSA